VKGKKNRREREAVQTGGCKKRRVGRKLKEEPPCTSNSNVTPSPGDPNTKELLEERAKD